MPKCPKCAVPLCRIEIQGVPVHTCPDCKGELVEDIRLQALERRADPQWTDEQKDAFCELADRSNNLNPIVCPRCGRQMDKFLFRHYANLQVDHCRHCEVHWLDAGELEKMQILYEEDQNSRTPADWDRIEKEARTLAAMDYRKTSIAHGHDDENPGTSAFGQILGVTAVGRFGRNLATGAGLDTIDQEADRIAQGLPAESDHGASSGNLARQPAFIIALLIVTAIIAVAAYLLAR